MDGCRALWGWLLCVDTAKCEGRGRGQRAGNKDARGYT